VTKITVEIGRKSGRAARQQNVNRALSRRLFKIAKSATRPYIAAIRD
jgi:hypothetical protein